VGQNAQVCVKAQASQRKNLLRACLHIESLLPSFTADTLGADRQTVGIDIGF
jgi:hypothetical protein